MRRFVGERGMTLTEVTVVFVLAAIVMTGLVVFYLNAQAVWMDGSTQVIAQREVTIVLDAISSRARRASSATIPAGDPTHVRIDLAIPGQGTLPDSTYSYWWSSADSLLHEGYFGLNVDRGPMLMSRVDCFSAHVNNATGLLSIDTLRVHTADGAVVSIATAIAMQNRGAN